MQRAKRGSWCSVSCAELAVLLLLSIPGMGTRRCTASFLFSRQSCCRVHDAADSVAGQRRRHKTGSITAVLPLYHPNRHVAEQTDGGKPAAAPRRRENEIASVGLDRFAAVVYPGHFLHCYFLQYR